MDFTGLINSTPLAGAVIFGIYMYFRYWRPAVKSSGNGANSKENLKALSDILIAINAQNAAKKYDTEQLKNLKSMVAQCQKDITDLRLEVAKHGS